MKTLFTTLNSKFIHSSLAIRSLKAYCSKDFPDIELAEFTINDSYERIINEIYNFQPDILGFSCYIWNIEQTLDIAATIKSMLPELKIVLGGPEVSYDSVDLLNKHSFIDFIVVGEGEQVVHSLLVCLSSNIKPTDVNGLAWRDYDNVKCNGKTETLSLDAIPYVYSNGFSGLENKIIYYETTRGCPYNCQYCLSSNTGGVRFLSMERIKKELRHFINSNVKQVKLVDRTFNCNINRAKEIFSYLIDLGGGTNFHFEMAGDLIDEETLNILKKAPVGLFQFEIGVQSANISTLNNIKRKTNLNKIENAVKELIEYDNIHVHLDLIAGLPEEDLSSMAGSINFVIKLKPHRLQLGFLKLLKGSGLRKSSYSNDYNHTVYPPYEVISNKYMKYSDLWRLKEVEAIIEICYNSHRFDRTISYLIKLYKDDAFILFSDISDYWRNNGYFHYSHSNEELFILMHEFVKSIKQRRPNIIEYEYLLSDLLLFDYCHHVKPRRYPFSLKNTLNSKYKEMIRSFFRDDKNIKKYIQNYDGTNTKQKLSQIHVEVFNYGVDIEDVALTDTRKTAILFDYNNISGVLSKAQIKRLDIKI